MTQHFKKWAKWLSQLNQQPKLLKKNLKNSILTGNRTLIYAMTGRNALSIKSIKPTGEQAIVSSWLFVIYPMVEIARMKIYEITNILNCE